MGISRNKRLVGEADCDSHEKTQFETYFHEAVVQRQAKVWLVQDEAHTSQASAVGLSWLLQGMLQEEISAEVCNQKEDTFEALSILRQPA